MIRQYLQGLHKGWYASIAESPAASLQPVWRGHFRSGSRQQGSLPWFQSLGWVTSGEALSLDPWIKYGGSRANSASLPPYLGIRSLPEIGSIAPKVTRSVIRGHNTRSTESALYR